MRSPLHLLAILTIAIPSVAAAQDQGGLSSQDVLRELATTYRVLADEEFLDGDRAAAAGHYDLAKVAAERLSSTKGAISRDELELIQTEVAYRQRLLASGGSFWGTEISARPINPVWAYVELLDTEKKLNTIIDEIASLQSADTQTVDYQIGEMQAQEDQQVAQLTQLAAETRLNDVTRRRDILTRRLEAITNRQTAIAAERGPLLASLERSGDALRSALIDGLGRRVGLPDGITPGMLTAAAQGDLESVITDAALAYAASGGLDGAVTALGEYGTVAQEISSRYSEIRETVGQVESGVRLLRAVQDGDAARIIDLGSGMLDVVSPETRAELTSRLEDLRSIETAVALAKDGTRLRDALAAYVAAQPEFEALRTSAVGNLLDVGSADFGENYRRIVTDLAQGGQGELGTKAGLTLLAQTLGPPLLNALLEDSQAREVAQALGGSCNADSACRAWLAAELRAGILDSPRVTLDGSGLLTIASEDGDLVAQVLLGDLAGQLVSVDLAGINPQQARAAYDLLTGRSPDLKAALSGAALTALPDESFDRSLRQAFAGEAPAVGQRAVAALTAPSDRLGPLDEATVGMLVGREVARRTAFAGAASVGPTAGDEALVQQALASAGPYGVVASIALTALKSMGEMDDFADRLAEIDKEDRGLTNERVHLTTVSQGLETEEAIAELEYRLATVRVTGAGRRMERYREALVAAGSSAQAKERKVRDSLPLTYYYAERMRLAYARLDQGIGFWAGGVGTEQRIIEATIRSDPSNVRLALDPEVRLFDWYGQSVSQRVDLTRLKNQWERLTAIAGQACETYRCRPNLAVMGDVSVTDPLSLQRLAPNAIFKPCESGRKCIEFMLGSDDFPDLAVFEGLRLVDVSGVLSTGSTLSLPNDIRITHSGLGFVRRGSEPLLERLEPSRSLQPRFVADDTAVQQTMTALQDRWTDGSYSLRNLEGYPLYGLYRLSVPESFNPATKTLSLRFFYQAPRNARTLIVPSTHVVFRCAREGGRAFEFTPEELPLLIKIQAGGEVGGDKGAPLLAGCEQVERERVEPGQTERTR